MLTLHHTLTYYKRGDIQQAMISAAKNKEVAIKYSTGGYGKRPDVLEYNNDIIELAKQGATSFHASEELWNNPMLLKQEMKKQYIDDLKIGWDLIIDIDCQYFEYSKIIAHFIIQALKSKGIKSVSCKFSGNKGFHIGVPFESFPSNIAGTPTYKLFPEAPRKIAEYLKYMIAKPVKEAILKQTNDIREIAKNINLDVDKIRIKNKDGSLDINADPIIQLDTLLISSRHMYRLDYSLHEKSGLASIPINSDKVSSFTKEQAKPENVKTNFAFLDRTNTKPGEATNLLQFALDFHPPEEKVEIKAKKAFEIPTTAIPEELFPDCIKKGLKGMEDGKKRFLFILINFLECCGWSYEMMDKRIKEWNQNNTEPLREVTLLGQLKYHKTNKKAIPPPNCSNKAYYQDLGIKCKECRVKNPVQAAKRRVMFTKKRKRKK